MGLNNLEAPQTETGNTRHPAVNPFLPSASPGMRMIERAIEQIAPTDMSVLLLGESGTGKEAVALQIHQLSGRGQEPFVKMSCAGLTLSSLHEGLSDSGNGKSADGVRGPATLLLEEISDLDPACQSELLVALRDGVEPPHGRGLRLISSSSRNLEEVCVRGFREDLYYRISGVCLRLPPLRQRKEDIPRLVSCFLGRYAALYGRPQPMLSSETLQVLLDHSWPGNIRELQDTVKKIVAIGNEKIAVADLQAALAESGGSTLERLSLKQAAREASHKAERELILRTLARTRWNRKRAALELRISYKALLYKLKQITVDDSAGT